MVEEFSSLILRKRVREAWKRQKEEIEAEHQRLDRQEEALTLAVIRIRLDAPDLAGGEPCTWLKLHVAGEVPCLPLDFLGAEDTWLAREGDRLRVVNAIGRGSDRQYAMGDEISSLADLGQYLQALPGEE